MVSSNFVGQMHPQSIPTKKLLVKEY